MASQVNEETYKTIGKRKTMGDKQESKAKMRKVDAEATPRKVYLVPFQDYYVSSHTLTLLNKYIYFFKDLEVDDSDYFSAHEATWYKTDKAKLISTGVIYKTIWIVAYPNGEVVVYCWINRNRDPYFGRAKTADYIFGAKPSDIEIVEKSHVI